MKPEKGMLDKSEQDCSKEEKILNIFKGLCALYSVDQVKSPIIEKRTLFERGLGESSDVVSKEMFKVGSGNRFSENFDKLVLRPEGTAGTLRLYLNSKTPYSKRFFYVGSMFRKENPQKGRFREFTQGGIEFFRTSSIDIIDGMNMAYNFLDQLGLKTSLKINYLGSSATQEKVKKYLKENLDPKELSDYSKERLEKNPLRILDSKDSGDQDYLKRLNFSYQNFLSTEEKLNFKKITDSLSAQGLNFIVEPLLVRGLDYYQNLVFEIQSQDLGSQSTVLAGGEYKNLLDFKESCFGWAFGLERLALLLPEEKKDKVVLINLLKDDAKTYQKLKEIRDTGVSVKPLFKKNLQKSLELANKSKVDYCLILGENEEKNNSLTIKRLQDGLQKELKVEDILDFISKGDYI